jgi:hypothetical protein
MINITHSPSHGVLMAFVGTSFLWSKKKHEVIMFEQISPHGWFFSMVIYHPYMDNDLDGTNAVPDTILNMTNVHLLDETAQF